MTISRTQSTDNKYVDKEAIIESIKPLLTSRVRTESFVGTLHYNGNIFGLFERIDCRALLDLLQCKKTLQQLI